MTGRARPQPWTHRAIDRIAARRAEAIASRVAPWLGSGPVLDVGSGTGHNAAAIRLLTDLPVREADVIDFHRRGPGPRLFDGVRLPFETGAFEAALALHVLQYPAEPAKLLREMARVGGGRVLAFQAVGVWPAIAVNEWLGTPGAFLAARRLRYIPPRRCPVWPRRLFTPASFERFVRGCGFEPRLLERGMTWGLCDNLYSLEPRG